MRVILGVGDDAASSLTFRPTLPCLQERQEAGARHVVDTAAGKPTPADCHPPNRSPHQPVLCNSLKSTAVSGFGRKEAKHEHMADTA